MPFRNRLKVLVLSVFLWTTMQKHGKRLLKTEYYMGTDVRLERLELQGAKLYGVRAIPATVLVDQEGTIVARNLRGEELAAKTWRTFEIKRIILPLFAELLQPTFTGLGR